MYNEAKESIITFIKNSFDINDKKIKHKLDHTFYVVDNSEYLASKLNLDQEQIEVAKLIALFHDLGRFYEARDYKSFRENINKVDNATLSVKLLFNDNLIREFLTKKDYDIIINIY